MPLWFWPAIAVSACYLSNSVQTQAQTCTRLVQGAVPGDDPTVTDFSCDLQQCGTCGQPNQGYVNTLGPYNVIADSDITSLDPEALLTVLPNGQFLPIEPGGPERVVAAYFVWDWPVEHSGPQNQISLDLTVTMPGDQAWLGYQENFELPACVQLGTPSVDYVRTNPGSPLRIDGCAPLPGSQEFALGIGWRVSMPRMVRQGGPFLEVLSRLNNGQPGTPELPANFGIKATGLPPGAVLRSASAPAKLYFFTCSNNCSSPVWGDIIPTAPAEDFETISGNEAALIYLNNNDDSGVVGITDSQELPSPNGLNMSLHFANSIPGPLAVHVMMVRFSPQLSQEFPYIETVDRQLTPLVLDLSPNWANTLALGAARLRQVPDCVTQLECTAGSSCSTARIWQVSDQNGDTNYDAIQLLNFSANTPLVFDFPNDIANFCACVGQPFSNDNGCATPGLGWGYPKGLMLEAIGGLGEQVALSLETRRTDTSPWERRDCVAFRTMGFGFLVDGSAGPFETPSLGGYQIPTLLAGKATYPPEPVNLEDRLVPVQIEAPESFLRLNSNPIAGFHLAPGHQWVVWRAPQQGDPPGLPSYVSINSFADNHWPGFFAGETNPFVGITPREAYFQLTVQPGMELNAWSSLVDNLFIGHWPEDPRLISEQSCNVGGIAAIEGPSKEQCDCSTGTSVATGMCGASMGDSCQGDCGPCARTNKDNCKDDEPPCRNNSGTNSNQDDAPQCEDDSNCSESTTGHPIYLFSGEFFLEENDLRIPGRGHDFVWKRKYRSKVGPNSVQGNGWDFDYNIFLERTGRSLSNLVLSDGNTRKDIYYAQGDGTWAANGFFQTISFNSQSDPCQGDLSGDNVVSTLDLAGVLLDWNCSGACDADLSGDNSVNIIDLFLVLSSWGACPLSPAYEVLFPDRSKWTFFPFDGSPREGKLKSQVDRHGNRMSFRYDRQGRLTKIIDTLDRPIEIAYDENGFIASVTDFIGRQLRYEYYENGDAGGSLGDLKSVRSPIVTGTPNGNDFPEGKKTTYTYSNGFADERLNHNLLTITDPKGQHYLTNVYTSTQDSNDFCFDRVARQLWGDQDPETGDIIDLVYEPIYEANEMNAVSQTIVNDRNGNVTVTFFDRNNLELLRREYTGRWDPDSPTPSEDLGSPDVPKLRTDDPDYFETKREYNKDSLLVRIIHPNGNEVINVYDENNPNRRFQGNLIHRVRLPGPLGGDQSQISETFEYNTDFAGCCGSNFVSKHIDGRGHETLFEYDESGNRVQKRERIATVVHDYEYNRFGQLTAHVLPDNGSGHRRRDEYTYYPLGSQRGYKEKEVVNAGGLSLTTKYVYDSVGNIVQRIDPLGNDSRYVFNQLNQVVRTISRKIARGGGVRYQRDTFLDANGNIVRIDIQNVDETGAEQANSHISSVYEYDILNYQMRMCQEVGNYQGAIPGPSELPTCVGLPEAAFITTEHAYDPNRNRILIRLGEAVENRQVGNVIQMIYDERDLLFREVRALGIPGAGGQSSTQYDYDQNRNLKATLQGVENQPRITLNLHDGYGRQVSMTDPMGNRTVFRYDQNGNVTSKRREGELIDVPLATANIRLAETTYVYDFMDRRTHSLEKFFDTETQSPIGDGLAITQTVWSDNSQVTRTVNDNNHGSLITYDSANRQSVLTDAKGNTATYEYDANGNILTVTSIEKSDLGTPDEHFTTTYSYDGLDRRISMIDNIGNTTLYMFDSRNNRTLTIDALNHQVRYVYDGVNRLIKTVRDMDGDGSDANSTTDGMAEQDIITTQTWDDSSRLIAQTDDNGNATRYAFDALNRKIIERLADGTMHFVGSGNVFWPEGESRPTELSGFFSGYDIHNNRVSTVDANGSAVATQYDLLERPRERNVLVGSGVSDDTTFELFKYDGMSRLVHAEDNDSLVMRSYNSRSDVTRESLTIAKGAADQVIGITSLAYDAASNLTQCAYPSGRVVNTTFDELERKKEIVDSEIGLVARYHYIGPDRLARREYGNNTRTDYTYNGIAGVPNQLNDFGVKRIVRTRHIVAGVTCSANEDCPQGNMCDPSGVCVIDDRTYAWDRLYNKMQMEDIRPGGPRLTYDYEYDSIYRLVRSRATDADGAVVRDTVYNLDGVGNRVNVIGGPGSGDYGMDALLPEPADFQANQYSDTPLGSREYDRNGNLIVTNASLPSQRTIDYDYRKRVTQHTDAAMAANAVYKYDALNRRIERSITIGPEHETTREFYIEWRVCDELSDDTDTYSSYLYGLFIDEALCVHREDGVSFFYSDEQYTVTALASQLATTIERYDYNDFGLALVFDGYDNPLEETAVKNHRRFTGRQYDRETGWYYYRTRYLDSAVGRFCSRDHLGQWYDPIGVGNAVTYVGANPTRFVDPFGYGAGAVGIGIGIGIGVGLAADCYCAALTGQDAGHAAGAAAGAGQPGVANTNDYPDHMRHCVLACTISREAGPICSALVTDALYEPFLSNNDPYDYQSNEIGRSCASRDCADCCQEKWANRPPIPEPWRPEPFTGPCGPWGGDCWPPIGELPKPWQNPPMR